MSTRKLEETDEPSKIPTVDKALSKAIAQARMAKKMTQKDLATGINEKPQVVAEYEAGKAIPNPQIITKLEKHLGCKLPRGGKPKPVASPKDPTKPGSLPQSKVNTVTRGGPPKRR
jgi:putative transcription factor